MGLGRNNITAGKAFALSLKFKRGDAFLDKPEFKVQEKVDDKYVDAGYEHDVAGDLVGLFIKESEWEGSAIRNYTLALKDQALNEIYFVQASLGSMVGRGIANSVLALTEETLENVSIGLYASKPNADGKVFPQASVRQNDEIVRWKYGMDELPKPEEIQFKGKTQRDYTAAEIFLYDGLKALAEVIQNASPQESESEQKPTSDSKPKSSSPEAADDVDEDVPF